MESVSPRIGILASALGGSVWLIYWAGRVYKESYFKQFQIPYEILAFDARYYFFGSWSTVAVAMSALLLVANLLIGIGAAITSRGFWSFVPALLSIALLMIAVWLVFDGRRFQPDLTLGLWNMLKQLRASADVALMALLIPSGALLLWSIFSHRQTLASLFSRLRTAYAQSTGATLTLSATALCVVLFFGWVTLGAIAPAMGRYHGTKAIEEGKMGVSRVRSRDKWWLFVVRTDDGRNFLYDEDRREARFVKDDEIQEFRSFTRKNH